MKSTNKVAFNLISLKQIVEGTSRFTGQQFFDSLVKSLAQVLDVHGVWITEVKDDMRRLRAISFWLKGGYVKDYEYDVKGTPCELVLASKGICHIPDRVVDLYPGDPDLKPLGGVSYMGLALNDEDGTLLGHLALLDNKPMEEIPEVFAIFRIFASRAAAELRRVQAQQKLIENKLKLERLVNGSMDAIIELNSSLTITQSNTAACKTFSLDPDSLTGKSIRSLMNESSFQSLKRAIDTLKDREEYLKSTWIPGHLTCLKANMETFPAEAAISAYREKDSLYFALYLRNVKTQVETREALKDLNIEAAMLREKIEESHFSNIIGESPAITSVIELVRQVAPTDTSVLISGETGTGKELFARAIHQAGDRSAKPLITLNCAALPAELIESELFGHVKGAFTGAIANREGRFLMAHQGTIFLDEVGEMPLKLQAKLLRVLQEGEVQPIGSSRMEKVNVRVIAATNRDLTVEVAGGRFREDLFYRLSVFPIRIPPLREREHDVLLLARAFIRKHCQKRGINALKIDAATEQRLMAHSWPGNVRELQNIIERAFITSEKGKLDIISSLVQKEKSNPINREQNKILTERELLELQKQNIIKALQQTKGKISGAEGAARILQIPPTTLNSRIKKLGISM